MRHGVVAALALALGLATAARAQVSPLLVADRLQLALIEVREAEHAVYVPRGGERALTLAPSEVRRLLALAADHLTMARLATRDPDQQARLDEALADLDAARNQLTEHGYQVIPQLRQVEQEILRLRRAARTHVAALRDTQATPSATPRR